MSKFFWISTFALLSALFNYIGIYAFYKNSRWIERFKNYFLCFAAGVLISTPFLVAFPHAFAEKSNCGFFAVFGFVFMLFVDRVVYRFSKNRDEAFGIVGAVAIGFHSFVDGVIYTITFNASLIIGFLSASGLVAHEFAEGIITYAFLIAGGYNPKKAFAYAFAIAGLTTPLGAFVVYPVMERVSEDLIPFLVSFVGGILVYFSASHLIPETRDAKEKHSTSAFFLGILFVLLSLLYSHHH